MYKDLRASGKFSYDVVNEMFDRHQGAWPEALKLEDSNFKYIQPYINDGENRLEMCLGFKKEQRKFWLYNRFKYMDSKYNAGDASADSVSMRSWYTPASGETTYGIEITPYADIYATVLYGVAKSSVRASRNVASLVPCTLSHMEFTDTYIYSASQIKDFGELYKFRPDAVEFSKATNAQVLRFGSGEAGYTNPNLKALTLGNNVKLRLLDIRNCVNFGTGDQKTLPLDGCTNIEEVYADGTALRGITFANGGILKKLHLPATTQNLTLMNQKFITEFVCPDYSNITTLRLEGNSSTIDTEAIVRNVATGARVRLVGFTWEVADSTELLGLKAILDNYRGLDEQGGNMDTAQLSGTIHATSLTGEAIAEFNSKYPYVTISADSVESTRHFYNEDGSTLIGTVTCSNGVAQSAAPTQPEKAATAQYNYTKAGWNSSKNAETNNYDHSAVTMGDVSYYAAYSKSARSYTVTWKNSDGTTLKTETLDYGVTPVYSGSTPVDPSGEGKEFKAWNPAISPVTGNITYTATYDSGVEDVEISDSWDTIIANIDNGTYKTKYKLGNYKPLDLGTEGVINMQIVAMDADEASNGSGTVPLTFVGKELLATERVMNVTQTSAGGWNSSNLKYVLGKTINPLIPSTVADRIVAVNKKSYGSGTTSEKLWIPSLREILGITTYESDGPEYTTVFKDSSSRQKSVNGVVSRWWSRTIHTTSSAFFIVNTSGMNSKSNASAEQGVCLGFCLGTYV